MQKFFWKMAGADYIILEKSGAESQRSFTLIGGLFLVIICCMLYGFSGLFWKVFGSVAAALLSSLVVTFLIANIYRLNMLSLEPPTLRDHDEQKAKIFPHLIRYLSIALFAFFTAKCLEGLFFGEIADNDVLKAMKLQSGAARGELFIEHIIQLSSHHPQVWILTAAVVLLFLLPVILKFRLQKRKEYFSLRRATEIRIVLINFEYRKSMLEKQHRLTYMSYTNDSRLSDVPKYTPHEQKYSDEPFNTQKIAALCIDGSSKDFVNLSPWK